MSSPNGAAAAPEHTGTDGRNGEHLPALAASHSTPRPDYATTIQTLAELFPAAFGQPKPLKVGIHQDLIDRGILLPGECRALRWYVSRRQYQKALAAGGPRYDLDGNPCGEVTPDQAESARTAIINIDAKRDERRAREGREAFEALKAGRLAKEAEAARKRPVDASKPSPATTGVARLSLAGLKAAAAARRAASSIGEGGR